MGIIKLKEQIKNNIEDKTVQNLATEDKIEIEEGPIEVRTEEWDDPAIISEDESRIDENTRHYILNNGTSKTVISSGPVNYFNEKDKKWERIDNTLEEKEDFFESSKGKLKTRIYKSNKGKKVDLSSGDKTISWEYLGKKENNQEKKTTLKVTNEKKTKGTKNVNSTAVYENVEEGTDIQYCLNGNNLKENIIVREKSREYKYLFALKSEGLKIKLSDNSENLELYSEKVNEKGEMEEKVEFIIPSPYMYDANGVTSEEVYYELEPSKDGNFIFSVIASEHWINAEERAFPVIIDPQIVTRHNNIVEHQTYYRNIYTSSGSGTSYGNWIATTTENIYLSRSNTQEYKSVLTIKKSLINLMEDSIASVKLILSTFRQYSGYIKISGSSNVYYISPETTKVNIDITEIFKKSTIDFNISLEVPYGETYMEFFMSGNAPVIEIEYLTNENIKQVKKTASLAGIANAEINLANGSMTTEFCDVNAEDSVMGMEISHIHKRMGEDNLVGSNFRLNLNEKFIKYSDTHYIYTDAKGDKFGFRDYYYYIDKSGAKVYVTDKSLISIDVDGKMTCVVEGQTFVVNCEYKSITGLKAMTTLEGFEGSHLLEQRSDKLKEIDEKVKNYGNALNEFVLMDVSDGNFSSTPLTEEQLFTDYDETQMIISRSEALQYKSLKQQYNELNDVTLSDEIILPENSINTIYIKNKLLSIKSSIYELTKTLIRYTNNCSSAAYDEVHKNNILDKLNHNKIVPDTYYNLFTDEHPDYHEFGSSGPSMSGYAIKSQFRQRNLLLEQEIQLTNSLVKQTNLLIDQMDLIISKKEMYAEQAKSYYKEYAALVNEQKKLNNELPVNFLTDGKYIKGYNKDGKFVILYDRYENYAVIEYENYYVGIEEKSRISRVYDNKEKQVVFSYNENSQLVSITDIGGRNTCFTYDAENKLIGILYATGEDVEIEYTNNNISSVKELKSALKTNINYSYNKPTGLYNYSIVDNISLDQTENVIDKEISKETISYSINSSTSIKSTTITNDKTKEIYYFDLDGNCIEYRKGEYSTTLALYLSTVAEKYVHNPYWKGSEKQSDPKEVVIKMDKDYLGCSIYNTFVEGDRETTTIDQFNNPEKRETNEIVISKWTDDNNVEQQNTQKTTVDYTYDDNQKLIQEKTTIEYSNPAKTLISYKKYTYNAYGDVIRTESYVDGEEYTIGKTIEETVYDKNGNVIKSFTYNSLDTSSKFYTEIEYDENGKIIAEVDAIGENKTKLSYIDETSLVREETLPNGSKFAYGYDCDGTVTAISQSTEEGEENSTQKVYRYGEVVELKSGNNTIKYTYDHKRKIKSVDLNGEDNYVQHNYAESKDSFGVVVTETTTSTYKSGDVFISEKDMSNKLIKTIINGVEQLEDTYDNKNNVTKRKDKVTGKNYQFERDEFDRLAAAYEIDEHGNQLSNGEAYEYDEFGKLVKKISVGDVVQEYTYNYKTDLTQSLESMSIGDISVKPKLDVLGRNKGKELCVNNQKIAEENIAYKKVGDHATNMPSTIWFGDKSQGSYQVKDNLKYAYDKMGNIEKVYENGELAIRYQYDALNRLVREDNKVMNKTVLFVYDNNGNILKQRKFAFTLKNITDIEELESEDKVYIYDGDKLLSFNGEVCEYDETTGVQTKYRGKALAWLNRRVAEFDNLEFRYDGQGRRISKGEITYIYDSDGRLLKQSNGLEYIYDHSGISAVKYDNNTYFYRKDVLGNVISLLDNTGAVVVKYLYDAWGNHAVVDINGEVISEENHIGNLNPFRYRSYYYDTETKLYFLKTRYYDAEIGRFISQDGVEYLDPDTINGLNLYAYCANNPVMNVDPNGTSIIGTILLIIGISALVVGAGVATYAGVTSYNNGVRGWDLVGTIAEGFFTGAVIGVIIGGVIAAFIYGGPAVASFLGKSFSFGGFALAGGGTAVITLTGAQIAALGVAALLGLQIMFAKDPFVRKLERSMSENQKEQFQREIEDYKRSEGRGGADNLEKNILRELADFIKRSFK